MKPQCERIKEFCQYFDDLESYGIGYGLSDLHRKASELHLKPPEGF